MLEIFYMGGPLFMSILTLLLIGVLLSAWKYPEWLKEVGLLALALGILGQIIGLYSAFQFMESSGGVSQEIMAGGLKVSSITTAYGLIIYVISLILRIIVKPRVQ
jgi:biopolymer transport protein ExbB/TolQ